MGVIKDQPNNDAVNFTVSRLKDIQIVIDHFEIYPLITQKLGDYKLFKQVFNMMKNQEHGGRPAQLGGPCARKGGTPFLRI